MIRFAHSEYLYALLVLPGLLLLFVWFALRGRKLLREFGNLKLLDRLMPLQSRFKKPVKFSLLLIALGLVILGLANPQIGTKMEEVKRAGVDIIIALDVSSSMKAEDIKPNRLESAKQEISRMLDKLQSDRVALIVFGGDSYLQLPLTTDYPAARLILSTIDVDAVPVPGTAIGSALKLAAKSFVAGEKKHKVIILITDGENHEDDAIAAAKEAHDEGIVVHAIGMGLAGGAPIPVYQDDKLAGYKKDPDGATVITKLDDQALTQIAEAGGGRFIRASNEQSELDQVLKEVEGMEKKEFGAKVFTDFEDRFQYLLAAALILLVMEFFLGEKRNKWIARWSLVRRSGS